MSRRTLVELTEDLIEFPKVYVNPAHVAWVRPSPSAPFADDRDLTQVVTASGLFLSVVGRAEDVAAALSLQSPETPEGREERS